MAAIVSRPTPRTLYVDTASAVQVVPMPAWKRAIDIVGASFGALLISPLLLLIALAIMVDSRGGPIYRQTRVGRGGRTFTCWKFRSMHRGADRMLAGLAQYNEADGLIFKMRDDPRRTRVGRLLRRTSLDELPQLWNVIRGDMSLVGPRPPLVSEVMGYTDAELQRLACVPGMTGLWQVTLRGRHNFADMVELDTRYAESIRLKEDLRILLLTLPTVLLGRGSY
ncbi:MAG: sugar transferase [Dehalococcoidia bacterium]|nr:sugar transferase [Dehalococcoidia bacterium]